MRKSGFLRRVLQIVCVTAFFAQFIVFSGHFIRNPDTQRGVMMVLIGIAIYGVITLLSNRAGSPPKSTREDEQ